MTKQMQVAITLHENVRKQKKPYLIIGDENDEKGVVILEIGKNTYDKLEKLMTDGEAETPSNSGEAPDDGEVANKLGNESDMVGKRDRRSNKEGGKK